MDVVLSPVKKDSVADVAAIIEDMVYLSFDGVDTKRMSGSSMTQVCRTMPVARGIHIH